MLAKNAVQFIKQEYPSIYCFTEKGILKMDYKNKKLSLELKKHSRETLDRFIKDNFGVG